MNARKLLNTLITSPTFRVMVTNKPVSIRSYLFLMLVVLATKGKEAGFQSNATLIIQSACPKLHKFFSISNK